MSYRCRHFAIHELVPPHTFQTRGEKAWELLDERLLIALDMLRDDYGPMTVNNYFWGGDRSWSGLRDPSSPHYSPTSQHTFGRAADIIFADHETEHVRQSILTNRTAYPYITGLELGVPWLHIDTRNCKQLKTFSH